MAPNAISLLIGVWIFLSRQMQGGAGKAMGLPPFGMKAGSNTAANRLGVLTTSEKRWFHRRYLNGNRANMR